MNAAQGLADRLVQHGVRVIFGLPGEENLPLVEALNETTIELVVVRHEQVAAFMAATHSRLTGRPGVCLATLGPGALNLFTGLAHAELGGTPVVALTGQKASRDNDEGSFQVVDVVGSARPLIRWATTVTDPRDVVPAVDEAFNRATAGRPGAVLLECPEDILAESVTVSATPIPRSAAAATPAEAALRQASDLVEQADRPIVLASGGGADEATAVALTDFAERSGIGVLATQLGKGILAESHPLSMRTLGIHRPDYAHLAIGDADLVIAVGYQPVEHPPLAWNPDDDKTIVHIGRSPAAIERGYQPTLQLVGELASILPPLAARLTSRDRHRTEAIGRTINRLLSDEDGGGDHPPQPLAVVRALRAVLEPDDVVALDNGVYKIWFARHYPCERPNTLLLDNALATMGAGLAAGMEAARLDPARRTVAVCGDGGFLMNVQDLETACRLDLDLTVLVLRDDAYGFIGWHQEEQGRPRDDVDLGNPDLLVLARAFGATGRRVTAEDDLRSVLASALEDRGVTVVDCPVDYTSNQRLDADLYGAAIELYETEVSHSDGTQH